MLDVKALLTKMLQRFNVIGTTYSATASTTISNAAIDQNTDGASITVPAGTYVVIGHWGFNTRTGTGTTNSAIRMYRSGSSNAIAQTRVFASAYNWNSLECSAIVTLTQSETLKVCGASSRAYTTATPNWIQAVRIK